jgi:ATP-dependent DNA ligase
MEAELVERLPETDEWQYEPKWDGFRGILENLDGELHLWSRNARPLLRYFPELAPLGERLPPDSAVDGEVVVERGGALDFDALQMRLHPAESRIRKLSAEIPAGFVCFDVLRLEGEEVHARPLEERRAVVERLPYTISPATRDASVAAHWLERLEVAGFDGVIAKRLDAPYLPGSREAVLKVKAHKSADCVVMGVTWREKGGAIASLLLGLYDDGELRVVGHTSGFKAAEKRELPATLAPYETGQRGMGDPSRWNNERELEWIALRPELVVEVTFDHVSNDRIRHGTKVSRWREDKDPRECRMEQLAD